MTNIPKPNITQIEGTSSATSLSHHTPSYMREDLATADINAQHLIEETPYIEDILETLDSHINNILMSSNRSTSYISNLLKPVSADDINRYFSDSFNDSPQYANYSPLSNFSPDQIQNLPDPVDISRSVQNIIYDPNEINYSTGTKIDGSDNVSTNLNQANKLEEFMVDFQYKPKTNLETLKFIHCTEEIKKICKHNSEDSFVPSKFKDYHIINFVKKAGDKWPICDLTNNFSNDEGNIILKYETKYTGEN